MNVIGLDGKIYRLKYGKVRENCSSGHLRARNLLKELFPFYNFYEESYIDGGITKLYIDFFNPKLMLAVEVQGEQHRNFNSFFQGSISNFRKQKKRDEQKKEWCFLNNIKLIYLDDSEENILWEKIILNEQ